LKDRPQLDKGGAFIAVKLERLAEALKNVGRADESLKCQLDCFYSLVDSGTLRSIATLAATKPLKDIWIEQGNTSIFGRVLHSIVKSASKNGSKMITELLQFGESLEIDEYGLLLEHLLDVLSNLLKNTKNSEPYCPSLLALATRILNVYDQTKFPIRRQRVIACLLRISCDYLSNDNLQSFGISFDTIVNEVYSETGYDSGLTLYGENLRASIYASSVLRKENPSAMELKPALTIWTSLLSRCDNTSSLKERVDDIDALLSQLQAVADFLDMKGEDSLRLPVLRFIVRLYELNATPISAENYISSLSELGLQYLQLGYSGKAGLVLVKGQESIPKASPGSNAALRMQVSYAEYLLTIGNLEKWLVLIHVVYSLVS